MSSFKSHILRFYSVILAISLLQLIPALLLPQNGESKFAPLQPRAIDNSPRRVGISPLVRREDDDLLHTAADQKCKNKPSGQRESEKVE